MISQLKAKELGYMVGNLVSLLDNEGDTLCTGLLHEVRFYQGGQTLLDQSLKNMADIRMRIREDEEGDEWMELTALADYEFTVISDV